MGDQLAVAAHHLAVRVHRGVGITGLDRSRAPRQLFDGDVEGAGDLLVEVAGDDAREAARDCVEPR